jgi:UDP-glucose 4-epimerase
MVEFTDMSKLIEDVEGMRVLVTGGAGFIGSHTVDLLLEADAEVWVLDDISTGSLRNLKLLKSNPRFHFRRGTVTQYRVLKSLSGKVEGVIHLAALVSPYLSLKKPEAVNAVNVSGTLNVLRAAVKNKLQRVVFASSSSVYGDQRALPISEKNPLQPVTPYGVSKLAAEKYCSAFYRAFGLSTISLRYFNVYGERQSANPYSGVIAIFAKRFLRGRRPIIFGDGKQTRDFVHVSDVAQVNVQALRAKKGLGDAFNIGTGKATTINHLCSTMARLYGKSNIHPVRANVRSGDIRGSYATIVRARTTLGFYPTVDLNHGLRRLMSSLVA